MQGPVHSYLIVRAVVAVSLTMFAGCVLGINDVPFEEGATASNTGSFIGSGNETGTGGLGGGGANQGGESANGSGGLDGGFACNDGNVIGGSCYVIRSADSDKVNWFKAELMCSSVGMHLVSINSFEELDNVVVEWNFDILSGGDDDFWIGASDTFDETKFAWTNGDAFNCGLMGGEWNCGDWFWDEMQPNDNEGQNCLEVRDDQSHKVNDIECDRLRGYVCERRLDL